MSVGIHTHLPPLLALALAFGGVPFSAAAEMPDPAVAQDPPQLDPALPGPYGVGVVAVEVPAKHHLQEKLNTLIWYPASTADSEVPYIYYQDEEVAVGGVAILDAPVVEGAEYPVIVFSHGNGGLNYQSVFLTEHLASHGFIVISADHPGNTMFDYDPTSIVTGWFTRPKDVTSLINYMERQDRRLDSPFRGSVDTENIGVSGHSFGGYTALAAGGAELNFNSPRARCNQGDDLSCRLVEEASARGLEEGYLDLSDARIDATVPLAPWTQYLFREGGMSRLDIPVQVHGGGLDDTCPVETNIEPVYNWASGPKSFLEIHDAGHYLWSDICQLDPTWEDCSEPFTEMDLGHTLINSWVTSHFMVYLRGDTDYAYYLGDDFAAQYAADATWQESLGL